MNWELVIALTMVAYVLAAWESENARYNVIGYGEIAYLNYNDIEVIGNIHENADLLEVGEE